MLGVLGLYPNSTSIQETRTEILDAIDYLIDSCLLLEDDGKRDEERYVKMHDMVRDVAQWIASNEDNGLMITKSVSKEKLEILLNHDYDDSKIPDDYFEGRRELKVLSVKASNSKSYNSSVFSLNALESLPKLRALQLEGFQQLEGISTLAKLTRLEILHFHGSKVEESIDELGN